MWIWTHENELINTAHAIRIFVTTKADAPDDAGPAEVRAELLGGRQIIIEETPTNDAAVETMKYLGEDLLKAGDPING